MRKVLLDTNFLLIPYMFKINIFREIEYLVDDAVEYVVLSGVKEELLKLARNKGKEGRASKFALQVLEAEKVRVVAYQGAVDKGIVEVAKREGAVVCTNDKKLRFKLKKEGIPVIVLKGRSKIGWA